MDVATLLEHLAADGPRLTAAATRAGWDAPVPGLDWTVRELTVHTGAVQRWCADIVRRELSTNETGGSRAFQPDRLSDDALPDWFAVGHRELVETLAAASPDLAAWTFGRGIPPHEFWVRRQAHELAVHRADAEFAARLTPQLDSELAADGIAEALGFSAQRTFAVPEHGRVLLASSDGPSWLVTFGGARTAHEPHDGAAASDAIVRGSSAELYLWVWNRPSGAIVEGDEAIAALWTRTVRI